MIGYGEPVTEYSANTTTAAPPVKPDQVTNTTTTPADNGQTPYVKVALLPDKDVMVVIQGTKSADQPANTSQQASEASPSSTEDQSKTSEKPVQEGEILIPVVNTENIMATYVDSKPAEATPTPTPTETVAKLSATQRRQRHKSPLRHKIAKTTRNRQTRTQLADVVRNYLKSKSN